MKRASTSVPGPRPHLRQTPPTSAIDAHVETGTFFAFIFSIMECIIDALTLWHYNIGASQGGANHLNTFRYLFCIEVGMQL